MEWNAGNRVKNNRLCTFHPSIKLSRRSKLGTGASILTYYFKKDFLFIEEIPTSLGKPKGKIELRRPVGLKQRFLTTKP